MKLITYTSSCCNFLKLYNYIVGTILIGFSDFLVEIVWNNLNSTVFYKNCTYFVTQFCIFYFLCPCVYFCIIQRVHKLVQILNAVIFLIRFDSKILRLKFCIMLHKVFKVRTLAHKQMLVSVTLYKNNEYILILLFD